MKDILTAPKLTFLKVVKYSQPKKQIFDVSNSPRPNFSLALILNGNAEFYFDSKCMSVSQGDIVMVPAGTTYTSVWHDTLYITIHFLFEYPGPFAFNNKMKIQKITLTDFDNLRYYFENLHSEFTNQNYYPVLSKLYHILEIVYPHLKLENKNTVYGRIENAVDYISHHYASEFTINDLAEMCHLSVSHFHACFKESLGCSPIEYKHRLCIQNAKLLLVKNIDASIENISAELGFNSAIYFRRLFKSYTGLTPLQYRKIEKHTLFYGII